MKTFTQKCAALYCLFLLMGTFYKLQAAKLVYQPDTQAQKVDGKAHLSRAKRKLLVHGYCRTYHIPKEICLMIIYFVHDCPFKYRNKTLPNDLSDQDLSGFDFTGCQFTYTNLTDTNLANTILSNTICDYQKAFQENSKKHKLQGGIWYKENLPKDLKSIAEVYPKLNNNTHKVKLLQIACGLSRLPFYEGMEFYIKVEYWSCGLLQLKQVLGTLYGKQLICSLQNDLEEDATHYCWKTNYPQDRVNIDAKTPHANFDTYLNDFKRGLTKYQCSSEEICGFNWYENNITKNIQGLKKTYYNIKKQQLQQTACNIAHALSKSYQIQQYALLRHYLFYQHRLIELKKSIDVGVRNRVHYSPKSFQKLVPICSSIIYEGNNESFF